MQEFFKTTTFRYSLVAFLGTVVIALAGYGLWSHLNQGTVYFFKETNLTTEQRQELEAKAEELEAQVAQFDRSVSASEQKEVYLELGQIYHRLGELRQAEDSLKKALRQDSQDPQIYASLGLVHGDMGKIKTGEEYLRYATFVDPLDPDIWKQLIRFVRDARGGSDGELDQLYHEAAFKTEANVEILIAHARFLENLGYYMAAADRWQEILRQEPDDEDYYGELMRLANIIDSEGLFNNEQQQQ